MKIEIDLDCTTTVTTTTTTISSNFHDNRWSRPYPPVKRIDEGIVIEHERPFFELGHLGTFYEILTHLLYIYISIFPNDIR